MTEIPPSRWENEFNLMRHHPTTRGALATRRHNMASATGMKKKQPHKQSFAFSGMRHLTLIRVACRVNTPTTVDALVVVHKSNETYLPAIVSMHKTQHEFKLFQQTLWGNFVDSQTCLKPPGSHYKTRFHSSEEAPLVGMNWQIVQSTVSL